MRKQQKLSPVAELQLSRPHVELRESTEGVAFYLHMPEPRARDTLPQQKADQENSRESALEILLRVPLCDGDGAGS